MLNKYEYLLFDLDDTLLDFGRAQENAFKKLLIDENIDYNDELFETYEKINKALWRKFELGEMENHVVTSQRFVEFFSLFDKTVDGREVDVRYRGYLAEGNQLFDGVIEMLEKLVKTHKLYVASNGIGVTQHTRLKNNNLNKYFEEIFISEELGTKKPDIEFFEKIFAKIDVKDKRKVLMIGDTLTSDILGANNAGIDSCWININNAKEREILSTYEVENVVDILTL